MTDPFADDASPCGSSLGPGRRAPTARFVLNPYRGSLKYSDHTSTARSSSPLCYGPTGHTRDMAARAGRGTIPFVVFADLPDARCHPDARAMLARRQAGGDGGLEALRVLKRRLSDVSALTDLQRKAFSGVLDIFEPPKSRLFHKHRHYGL